MIKVAKTLMKAGCSYFYVANLNEGVKLREELKSKDIKIAIFEGFLKGSEQSYVKYKLTPIINNLDQLIRLKKLISQGCKIKAILNIDTGMNRLGFSQNEISLLLTNKELLNFVEWDFIMSHLANAHQINNKENFKQLDKILQFSKNLPNIKLSLANSGGIMLGSKFCLDQTRPGIGLFGIDNFGNNIELNSRSLKLPLSLYGPVIQLRDVDIGEKVSYGGVDMTKRKSKLATIGIGYADGWLRLLKPNSSFFIMKKKCRIIGNVTMDSFVLDVTDLKEKLLKEGDYLCLLDNTNIKNIVTKLDIISYELLTIMGNRLLRKYN
jgi:alanine racemase